MQKHELLVPAGSMECLYQAVYNGADAVYLGCKDFGARKFAANFTNEEIVEAVHFCHLYGVRLYVTMNTLIKNSEVEDFLEQVRFLHQNGVDALIMQDFGMICLVREMFPNLEIHASTQANISSLEVCKLYHKLGVKRVVFSRELSLEEIDAIDVPIEKEAFIHGALCISYSGECLMSSMLGGRSGNRGECAGCCRMNFSLEEEGKITREGFLLSTKELNTSSSFDKLLKTSIDSFKIEGRMKSPLYVGFITRFYRKLMDHEVFSLEEETQKLQTIFNREFTKGRILKETDENLMNPKSPNHIGLEIGKVVDISPDKIKLQLNKHMKLHQHDAIRFLEQNEGFIVNYLYDEKGSLVSEASNFCFVDNKVGLKKADIVCKTQDSVLEKEYQIMPKRKIAVTFRVKALKGENLVIEIRDGIHVLQVEGDCVEKAKSQPISKEGIIKQLNRLGESPFSATSFDIQMEEDIFIPVHALNEMRRKLVSQLVQERQKPSSCFLEKSVVFERENHPLTESFEKVGVVRNLEQFQTCRELGFSRIYTSCLELYEKYKNIYPVYYIVDRCIFDIMSSLKERNLVSDFADYSGYEVVSNYTFNVFNIYTAYYLQKMGISSICLSVELDEKEISSFMESYSKNFGNNKFEVLCYGRVENMLIKGNVLNLSKEDGFLIDFKKRKFPVYYDGRCTHILNWEEKKMLKKFPCTYRFDFYQETRDDIIKIVKDWESE